MSGLKLQPGSNRGEPEVTRLGRLYLPGATVGRWVVTAVLREEPDHVIYEATLGAEGPPAALKVLDRTVFHDARYYKCLRRVARRWKRVEDPHLARLLEAGKSPDGPYLATELVPGGSLALELESGALPRARAAQVVLELAGALDAVLDAGITPAALTPQNVVMSPRGAVVTDPGVWRARQNEGMIEADDALDYLSPEEAVGAPPEPQSAVYSLGCIAYHCLTGEPPYPRDVPQAVFYAHVAEPPARPHARDGSLPMELDEVFERAMAADPDERQPTPGALARELVAVLSPGGEKAPALVEPDQPPLVVVPDVVEPEPVMAEPEETPDPRPQIPGRRPQTADRKPKPTLPEPARREQRERPQRSFSRSMRVLRPAAAVIAIAACATAGVAAAGDPDIPAPAAPRAEAGPPPGALAAQGIAKRLDGRRARLRARLAEAPKRAGQAELAGRLSSTYAASASRSPAATPPEVRQALRGSARAYARLAAAARRGKAPAWNDARARVRSTDLALARALRRTSASR